MNHKAQIESMMKLYIQQGKWDAIKTSLTPAQLKNAGCSFFGGKFTASVKLDGGHRTFEILPGARK